MGSNQRPTMTTDRSPRPGPPHSATTHPADTPRPDPAAPTAGLEAGWTDRSIVAPPRPNAAPLARKPATPPCCDGCANRSVRSGDGPIIPLGRGSRSGPVVLLEPPEALE